MMVAGTQSDARCLPIHETLPDPLCGYCTSVQCAMQLESRWTREGFFEPHSSCVAHWERCSLMVDNPSSGSWIHKG